MGSTVGCDVSKARIDVVLLGGPGKHFEVANEKRSIESFVRQLPPGSQVGMEATGVYHELLADILVGAGHSVFVINPRWIHAYARGLGMRGKTDRNDAQVIARYVSAEHGHLHAYVPPNPQQRELRLLLHRRLALAKLRVATRQSLGTEAGPVVKQFEQLSKRLERRIQELVGNSPEWLHLAKRLRQLPGVGPLCSAQMVATLTRQPFANADAFVAHTGTDPRPNDSGQKQGRRRLTHHGDVPLRTLLFMAAMNASRNPTWRPYYQAQRDKGLSGTAAFIILARKIARIAFSLYKTGQDYDPNRSPRPQIA